MALVRRWVPSPNFSAGAPNNQLVIIHTSEGARTEADLAAFLGRSSSAVSYHVCFDNVTSAGQITECVRRGNRSWSAMTANSWGRHGCCCTPSGASAGWSRQTWLSQNTMLVKCAAWIAEECAASGIPPRFVNSSQIRAGTRGVCGHGEVSGAGAGGSHFDPGPQFPWDVVLQMAAGGGGAPTPPSTPTTRRPDMLEVPGNQGRIVAIPPNTRIWLTAAGPQVPVNWNIGRDGNVIHGDASGNLTWRGWEIPGDWLRDNHTLYVESKSSTPVIITMAGR